MNLGIIDPFLFVRHSQHAPVPNAESSNVPTILAGHDVAVGLKQ